VVVAFDLVEDAMDFLSSGILGSLLGGLFRLAPELMKLWDRANERKHEREMFGMQVDLEKQRGDQKLAEIGASHQMAVDTGVLDAFKLAIEQQTELAKAAGGLVAKASAAVRPLLTYWIWTLYSAAFLTLLWVTWQVTHDPKQLATLVLTGDFIALLCGITNYWFMDRTLAKRGLA
jgi:hypothetical protein